MNRFRCLGLTSDGRSNHWEILLPCGHKMQPLSTMRATQRVQCDHCGAGFFVDYNTMEISKEPDDD